MVARRPLSTSYIKDTLQDPHKIVTISSEQYHLDGAYGIRHGYCIALMVGDQPFGFLNAGSSHVEPPSESDIEIIRILALETGSVFLRLKVEDRLQKVNAEQRVILETTPVGIVHLKDRKVQWANPAFGRILGYKDEESVGLDSASFYVSREESERVPWLQVILSTLLSVSSWKRSRKNLSFKTANSKKTKVWVAWPGQLLITSTTNSKW